MERYYSSVLTPSGLLCNFKILCEKHPDSKFYILSDGTDFERSIFFDELCKLFENYSATIYSPFYDEAVNGIYLKNFDTYILSDSLYSRVCPIFPEICEVEIHLSKPVRICKDEKELLTEHYINERKQYKKAISNLSLASMCKENRNSLLSDYLIDDRMINALRRIIKKIPSNIKIGKPTVKFLSAVTPLGIHTIWDTVFENYDTVIELQDSFQFSSAIITGIIRDNLIAKSEEFILVPDLFHKTIPQMILLPQISTALIRTDDDHPLPFSPVYRINTEKFISIPKSVQEKHNILFEAENKYLKNAVEFVFEGRDERRKKNKILLPYSDAENAKQQAREIYNQILSQ